MSIEELNPEKLLSTDNGRFVLELEKNSDSIQTYIDAANIDDTQKERCREIITKLQEDLVNDKGDTAGLAYNAVNRLLSLLNQTLTNDTEGDVLFKALRDIIYESRKSAVGRA